MIIREVRLDVYQDPTPGIGRLIALFSDTSCANLVADVNPATVGETVLPFDRGLAIAAGSALSMTAQGSVAAEAYTDGYSVPSSQVPAAPAAATRTHLPQQEQ